MPPLPVLLLLLLFQVVEFFVLTVFLLKPMAIRLVLVCIPAVLLSLLIDVPSLVFLTLILRDRLHAHSKWCAQRACKQQ